MLERAGERVCRPSLQRLDDQAVGEVRWLFNQRNGARNRAWIGPTSGLGPIAFARLLRDGGDLNSTAAMRLSLSMVPSLVPETPAILATWLAAFRPCFTAPVWGESWC